MFFNKQIWSKSKEGLTRYQISHETLANNCFFDENLSG